MLRTSEMHCHRRSTRFLPRYLLPPLPHYTNNRKVSTSFLFLHPRQNSLFFLHLTKERFERNERLDLSFRKITDEIEQMSISSRALTLFIFLPTWILCCAAVYIIHLIEIQLLYAAFNSTFFFFVMRKHVALYLSDTHRTIELLNIST